MGIVRAYQSDDEIQVNALYYRLLKNNDIVSPIFNKNDFPSHLAPITYVYEDGKSIIGFSSILPIEAYIHGKEANIGILETIVEDEQDAVNISKGLNSKLIEIAEEMDLKTLINLNMNESKNDIQIIFETQRIGEIPRFTKKNMLGMHPLNELWKKIKKDTTKPLYEAWEIEEQENPDEVLSEFIYKKRKWKTIHIKKHETHYQCSDNHHPNNKYQYLKLTYDGEMTGYAVINTREKGKLKEAYITDILAIDHPEAWDVLLQAVREKLKSFDIIELCICPDKLVMDRLKKNGFKESNDPVNINIIDLDESLRGISVDEWWLLLGDTKQLPPKLM